MDLFWQVAGEGSVAVEGWDYRQAIIIVAFYFLQFNLIFFLLRHICVSLSLDSPKAGSGEVARHVLVVAREVVDLFYSLFYG